MKLEKPWTALKPGDLIDVVAPASSCPMHEVIEGVKILESWGYQVRVPQDLFNDHPYLAHEDARRAADLIRAFSAPDSKAVWCVRGGYGAMRVIPALLSEQVPHVSKLFIGLSDITSLHVFLEQKWGWPVLHAPLLSRLGGGRAHGDEITSLQGILSGAQAETHFENLKPLNQEASLFSESPLSSSVVGGNLSLLQCTLGTDYQIQTRGRLLFLEEVSERGYRIDRMLTHLQHSHIFQNCLGVLWGDVIGGEERDGESHTWRAITEFAASLNIPVWRGIRSGHGTIQMPLPFGTPATLVNSRVKTQARLTVSTGVRQ